MRPIVVAAVVVLALGGAWVLMGTRPARIDASSEEAAKRSIARIKARLSLDEQERFEKAAMALVFSGGFRDLLKPDALKGDPLKPLHGMTAQEVIAKAEARRQEEAAKAEAGRMERAAKERAQALQEIQELEAKIAKAEADKAELEKFKVVRSRFYREKDMMGWEPKMALTLKNGTPYAISRAYFVGTLSDGAGRRPRAIRRSPYQSSRGSSAPRSSGSQGSTRSSSGPLPGPMPSTSEGTRRSDTRSASGSFRPPAGSLRSIESGQCVYTHPRAKG